MNQRKVHAESYSEQEFWDLMHQTITALSFLQQNHICHGDIRTQQIYLSKAPHPVYKFTVPQLLNVSSQYYQIIQGQHKLGMYLSPKLMECLKAEQWVPIHDKFRSDVFSLGKLRPFWLNLTALPPPPQGAFKSLPRAHLRHALEVGGG